MSGFWEHKLLSPTLWALGLQERRQSTGRPDDGQGDDGPRPDRKMADSYCEVNLPFRTEAKLAEDYTSIYGGIRVGKLLEDLDVLAASIAYIHCDDLDLTIVTAAVDRIDLLLPIDTTISNVRMRGSVTYVGRSSIEVTISVETDQVEGTWDLAALAKFILVARSPSGRESVEVNKLVLETPREREIFERGRERHKYRLLRSERSLFRQPPAEDEVRLVHEICMPSSDEGGGGDATLLGKGQQKMVPMAGTRNNSVRVCHPQERNIHNFIFGGYLCREAFELAFVTVNIFFDGKRPCLKSIDDIAFVHPVPIGSIVDFRAEVIHSRIHSGDLYACVQVTADVLDPAKGTRLTTNTFHFTLTHPTSGFPQDAVPCILPATYVEAMKYLEGKRRVDFDLSASQQQHDLSHPPHFDPNIDK